MRLTKRTIDALKPPPPSGAGYKIYFDEALPGFGAKVTATGKKIFVLDKRIAGRSRRITIARYGVLTVDQARCEARKLLGQIATGTDPVAKRQRERLEAISLEKAFENYIEAKDLRPRTKDDMRRALSESFDDWRKKPVSRITREMVQRRYLERAERSKARANLGFRYLRAVLNLAMTTYRDSEGKPVIEGNAVRALTEARLWRKVPRRRTVLAPDDLKVWMPAIMRLAEVPAREPGTGRLKPKLRNGEVFRDLFMFLAMTGARKSEALGLRKADIDMERGIITFKNTKNGTDHELPITQSLRELLERRLQDKGELIFAGGDGRVATNVRYAAARIRSETGLKFTPHDLRRLCATTLERLAVPTFTVRAILNHQTAVSDVTGGYVQVDLAMKRAALEKLEAFLMQYAVPFGKVIALRR